MFFFLLNELTILNIVIGQTNHVHSTHIVLHVTTLQKHSDLVHFKKNISANSNFVRLGKDINFQYEQNSKLKIKKG